MNLGFWTEERVERLRQMAAAGFSGGEISERLGEGCTRNAVAGKAFRMGIHLKSGPVVHKARTKAGAIAGWRTADPARRQLVRRLAYRNFHGRT